MKRLFFLLVLISSLLSTSKLRAQIKISDMPTYTGDLDGGFVPIVISGANRKAPASNFGYNKLDSISVSNDSLYSHKAGVATFKGIIGGGGSSLPYRAIELSVTSGSNQTTLINSLLASSAVKEILFDEGEVIINAAVTVPAGKKLSFRNGARITGSGSITGGVIDADLNTQIFDTTLTVTQIKGGTGIISAPWFGLKHDALYDVPGFTDNATPLEKALAAGDRSLYSAKVYLGGNAHYDSLGRYAWIGRTITINRTVELYGNGKVSTMLMFEGNDIGLIISSQHAYIHDFTVSGAFGGQSQGFNNDTAHGIVITGATNRIERVGTNAFDGDGFQLNGSSSIANINAIIHCSGSYNGRYGINILGGDANANQIESFNATGNAQWGIRDGSFLGNTWVNAHTAANGLDHSENRTWVKYPADSIVYGALLPSGPGTSAGVKVPGAVGSELYWQQVNYSLPFPENWNNSTNYFNGGGYLVDGSSQQSVFLSCYGEDDQFLKLVTGPGMFIGGFAGRYGAGRTDFGIRQQWPTMQKFRVIDARDGWSDGFFLDADGANSGGAKHFGVFDDLGGGYYSIFGYDKNTKSILPFAAYTPAPLFQWFLPGYETPSAFGRSAMPQYGVWGWWNEGWWSRVSETSQFRNISFGNAAHASGEHAAGDIRLNSAAGPVIEWKTTTSGTPGTSVPVLGSLGPQSVAYSSTITIDASQIGEARITLAGNPNIAAPVNPTDGQSIVFHLLQDATGGRTVTWTSGAGGFAFSTDIPMPTLSTGENVLDLVAFKYSAAVNRWICMGYNRGFSF
jgi:hypothetical protein